MDWLTKMTQKTLADFTEELKATYPTLTKGNNNDVITLESDEYESVVAEWAKDKLAALEKEAADKLAEEKAKTAKEAAQAKLAALGLTTDDLKALGL
jgi:membrane protein involved in colicin uptake